MCTEVSKYKRNNRCTRSIKSSMWQLVKRFVIVLTIQITQEIYCITSVYLKNINRYAHIYCLNMKKRPCCYFCFCFLSSVFVAFLIYLYYCLFFFRCCCSHFYGLPKTQPLQQIHYK